MKLRQSIMLTVMSALTIFQIYCADSIALEEKIWPVPQIDGSIRMLTRTEALVEALLSTQDEDSQIPDKILFYLFTQTNPITPIELDMDNVDSLLNSTFNSKHPTRFMIHGWNDENPEAGVNRVIRDALLLNGQGKEFNFIAVDWRVYGCTPNYILAVERSRKAGKVVGQFIDWLHDKGNLSFKSLSVFGHSLGAHVAGFSGKYVTRGRIHNIIGLDPAMPFFEYNKLERRLATTDAEYVETIHTNGGKLGFYQPIGHASFYPNGGKSQPGCGIDLRGLCSHGRSIAYLTEAIWAGEENSFHAIGCKDLDDMKKSLCNDSTVEVRLGDPNNAARAHGIYYLKTSSKSPFGLGKIFA